LATFKNDDKNLADAKARELPEPLLRETTNRFTGKSRIRQSAAREG
jgi:hypothetical protein